MRNAHEQIHNRTSAVIEGNTIRFNSRIVYRSPLIRTSRMWREIFKKIGMQHGGSAEAQVSCCVLRVGAPGSPGRADMNRSKAVTNLWIGRCTIQPEGKAGSEIPVG